MKQGIISTHNPRGGAEPRELNHSLTYYEAGAGYRLRFGPYAWSPYAEPYMGYMNYKLYVDNSQPESFTTQQYTGFKFGVNGAAPLSEGKYGVGGEFAMVWKPRLKESPVTSGGSSESQVVQFGILGFKRIGERLKAQVNLDFEMYASNFSGNGTRAEAANSSSQRHTTLSGGLYYMF
jgi:hypothetical protein